MDIIDFPLTEPALNKNEKIILEYLLNEFEISSSRHLKIPLNLFKNDLDLINNLHDKLFQLSIKKIVFKDKETQVRTFCFNIIDSYSLVDNHLLIVFSEQLHSLLINRESIFYVYSLLFQNKYTLKLFQEFSKYEGSYLISVDELKEKINLSDSYERLYDFERKILKNGIQEINSYTNLQVSYEKKYSKIKNEPIKILFTIEKTQYRKPGYHENFKKTYDELLDRFKSIYDF